MKDNSININHTGIIKKSLKSTWEFINSPDIFIVLFYIHFIVGITSGFNSDVVNSSLIALLFYYATKISSDIEKLLIKNKAR